MKFKQDRFNGIIINKEDVPSDTDKFIIELLHIVLFAQSENKNIVWLTLPIYLSHLVPKAINLGFVFHNCLEQEVTLILKAPSTSFIPFVPTHSLGAGAVVKNSKGQLLVIKEYGMNGYKLPGGHIELGEKIEAAIIREVVEETGVHAVFGSILGFTTRHPFKFSKTNMYLICRLHAVSETINVRDTNEIAEAKWIDIDEFLGGEGNSSFNRQMVEALHNAYGLALFEPKNNIGSNKKYETFFASATNS